MSRRRLFLSSLFVLLLARCHDESQPTPPCDPGIAAEQILADESGKSLAEVVRLGAVPASKAPLAAAYWALVIDASTRGEATPELLEWNAAASLAANTSRLAQATPSCPSALSQPVISTPPSCTDDCMPPIGSAFRNATADWLEASLQPGNAALLAEVHSLAEFVRGGMKADESQAETERRIREAIAPDQATRFLTRITRLLGKEALVANAIELLGLSIGAAAVSEVAAIVGALALATKTAKVAAVLKAEYRACQTWKAENCSRHDGGDDAGDPMDAGALDGGDDAGAEDAGHQDAGPQDAGPSDAGFSVCDAGGRAFMPLTLGASWTYSVMAPMATYQHVLRVSAPGTLSYERSGCSNPPACPGSGTLTSTFLLTAQGLEWSPQVGPSSVVFAFPKPPGYRWTCWPFDFHGIANVANQYLEVVSNDEQLVVQGVEYCTVHYRSPSGDVWFSPGVGVVRSTLGSLLELQTHSP